MENPLTLNKVYYLNLSEKAQIFGGEMNHEPLSEEHLSFIKSFVQPKLNDNTLMKFAPGKGKEGTATYTDFSKPGWPEVQEHKKEGPQNIDLGVKGIPAEGTDACADEDDAIIAYSELFKDSKVLRLFIKGSRYEKKKDSNAKDIENNTGVQF